MNRLTSSALILGAGAILIAAGTTWRPAAIDAAGPGADGVRPPAHRFDKVAEGVYAAIGTGAMNVGSNTAVIVNQDDVLIVDSHITPSSARALIEEVRTITDKPIRYVVNSHFHFDHAHGNQVFGPGVEIIGHEFTRRMLAGDPLSLRTYRSFTSGVPAQIATLRDQVRAEQEPARKALLEMQLAAQEEYLGALEEIRPTPPSLTIRTKLTLYRGGREIQLHFFGRGHTGGDVVVFLPKERIVCTGDLMTAGIGYMGDGHPEEWVATLEALKALEFDTIIPGHGAPYRDRVRIDAFQAYLRDFWKQATDLHAKGVTAEEAAKRIDLTAHKGRFPTIQGPGADLRAVQRIYDLRSGIDDPR
jgi:glyoxylase-like metal-dependent hydrolase (beta-lactamase superfamily II)